MKKTIDLPYNFTPRVYQENILAALDDGAKRCIWLAHRRLGKDLTIWNWIIKELMNPNKPPRIAFYIFPTFAQAKTIIWEGMTKDGVKFLNFIPKEIIKKKSETDLSIRFVNDSYLRLMGSDHYDRLIGNNPSICVFSEFAVQNPTGWNLIRPILAENEGIAIFISTPRGKNHFYDLYTSAQQDNEWFCEKLTVNDTKAVTLEAIAKERSSGMSDELAQQEFYCSFDIGMEGSYYGKYIREMQLEGRIGHVPLDKNLLVYTCFDIGFSDSTAILFFQQRGNEILIVDYYENRGFNLAHYIEILKAKPYTYGNHFIPHDGKNHNATGTTFQQVGRELGINMEVLPREISVIEGIERVRGIFPRVFMDERRCEYLIKCLLQYHAEYNSKDHIFKNYPRHDWSSHSADAFRYMTTAITKIEENDGLSVEEWRRMKEEERTGRATSYSVDEFFKPG